MKERKGKNQESDSLLIPSDATFKQTMKEREMTGNTSLQKESKAVTTDTQQEIDWYKTWYAKNFYKRHKFTSS